MSRKMKTSAQPYLLLNTFSSAVIFQIFFFSFASFLLFSYIPHMRDHVILITTNFMLSLDAQILEY